MFKRIMNSIGLLYLATILAFVSANWLNELTFSGLSNRIIGGDEAKHGQFPHQVSLRRKLTKQHFCGASILSERFILTAAHCSRGLYGIPANVIAVVGAWDIKNDGKAFGIKRIVSHPSFNLDELVNDIAMLITEHEIPFSDFIKPIALPTEDTLGGSQALISGWGRISYPTPSGQNELPTKLQYKETHTLTLTECSSNFKGLDAIHRLHESNVCTTNPMGKGACMGDSGGPLISKDNVLIGIVSWGIPCGRGFPDVYTKVYSHIEWIDSIMKNDL